MTDSQTIELETFGPDELDRAAVRDLVERPAGLVVTVSQPTDRAAVDAAPNDTPLKNALREARQALDQAGHSDPDALLAPAESLLREGRRDVLDGEVLYLWAGGARRYRTAFEVTHRVEVAGYPVITPLLPGLATAGAFVILGLSQGRIRLLRATKTTVAEIDLEAHDVPTAVEELAGPEEPPEVTSREGGRAGDPAIFHGHVDERRDDVWLDRLFRDVEQGARALLMPHAPPIVLAGIEKHRVRFHRVAEQLRPLEDGVDGDPADQRPDELRDAAWPIAAEALRAPIRGALDDFGSQAAAGRASTELAEILHSAPQGRIGTLLMAEDARVWGQADLSGVQELRGNDDREPGDEDLVDRAARLTLEHGGEVFTVESGALSNRASLAARFRF